MLGDKSKTYTMDITGSFDLAGDKGHLAVDLGAAHIDEIFANGNAYVKGVQGVGDGWGSIRRDKAEAHYVLRAPLNDPEHVLQQVAAMRQITKIGQEQVDGVPAAHYRGTIDYTTLTLRMAPRERIES
ncbi:hypothetical protein [Streptomyces hypolithicus]